ncbi:hypothetical protein [Candidatus Methanodesulfokora washburnensis]|jgi:hypothetical protein|uniref:Uncharacterized protein n=1 Tax=Candidatus Methanodesulfokora washburnensis TaxID=2478471 RepID=A0A429GQZ0_9CREN|nr:hypothetical protein [Candidatus Methanodesulfokores washburnensis]RSN76298.1 hypothetical protein D6D85_04950 [Candidatus Methanodesulfokores washburnensis]
MSLKKIFAGISVIAVIFLAVLILRMAVKPSLTVKSVELTDVTPLGEAHYPGIKILFKTDKYPVKFYLLTPEGEVMDSYKAELPEEVAYLTIGNPYENVIGSREYVIKAFIGNEEVLKREIEVKGLSGSIRILGVKVSITEGRITEPEIEKILIEVENTGDVPLYIVSPSLLSSSSPLSIDGHPCLFKSPKEVIMPGSREKIELPIPPEDLEKSHTFTISVPGVGNASYTTEPLRPEVRIDRVELRYETFVGGWVLDNITMTIRNTEAYPISLYRFKVYADDRYLELCYISPYEHSSENVNPGEEKTVTIECGSLSESMENKPSIVRVKLYGTEAVYRVP